MSRFNRLKWTFSANFVLLTILTDVLLDLYTLLDVCAGTKSLISYTCIAVLLVVFKVACGCRLTFHFVFLVLKMF